MIVKKSADILFFLTPKEMELHAAPALTREPSRPLPSHRPRITPEILLHDQLYDNGILSIETRIDAPDLELKEEASIEDLMGVTLEFEGRLRLFKYLLFASGLHVHAPTCYVYFLRSVIWSCTLLCAMNLIMQTRAYRHPFFDIILVFLHIWVSVQYEYWRAFMRTTHWKTMMDIVTRHGSKVFSERVARIGYLACITVPGATAAISFGWLAPIFSSMLGLQGTGPTNDVWYGFLFSHGALMVIIVFPWACVCLCGVFLFHLVVLAHTTDLEQCLVRVRKQVKDTITTTMYNSPLNLINETRERLRMTYTYFNWVYASALVISLLMVLCGCVNLAWRFMVNKKCVSVFRPKASPSAPITLDPTRLQMIYQMMSCGNTFR